MMVHMMTIASLSAFSTASRQSYVDAYSLVYDRALVIFQVFGLDTGHGHQTFLSFLDHIGGIVSGSAVTNMLLPDPRWTPHDLDVYVPHGGICEALVYFRNLGYRVHRLYASGNTLHGGVLEPEEMTSLQPGFIVFKLLHAARKRFVDIVCPTYDEINPITLIFTFHSSAVMNFLTATGIYCCYPALLDKMISAVNPFHDWSPERRYERPPPGVLDSEDDAEVFEAKVLTKYIRRGFELRS